MYTIFTVIYRMLSIYLGATLTFYALSFCHINLPHSSFYARILASYGTLLACTSYGVIISIILRLLGKQNIAQWVTARAFHYTMYYTTGVRFEIVEGKEYLSTRPAVLIANHQSELDVLMLGTVWPRYCSVTAKSSLARTPFLGWFMALSGTVFIDRSDRQSAVKAFEKAAVHMKKERQSVFIFPEGTRSYARGPEMGMFKKGAFHLAVQAGVDVIPVVVANYAGLLSVSERRFRAGRIPVKVLKPIPTTHLKAADVDDLTKSTRDLMLKELITLTESPLGQKATKAEISPGEEDLAQLAAKQR
ncbi:hypothetical protein JMJ35_006299 [Cladonia borealis]|uniref:1-acyl-sn-glycerol-3-phosphate acyltransferase n=1 Tax=Cladonia borealis TaxID=184061 RepID=A0AA39R0C3_9LECA|nr:hypothetical protein JMJ35_006299 [Cladonia borealis]